jgi:hypothetical protein
MAISIERESIVGIISLKKVNSPYTNMKKMGKGVCLYYKNHLSYSVVSRA